MSRKTHSPRGRGLPLTVQITADARRKQAAGFAFRSMQPGLTAAFPGVDIDRIHYKLGKVKRLKAAA